MIKLLFFAGMAESIGSKELTLELHEIGNGEQLVVQDVKLWLEKKFPEIRTDLNRAMIAVNEEFVETDSKLNLNDTIAFIPPVSGG